MFPYCIKFQSSIWYEILHVIRKTRIIQLYYHYNLCRFWNMIVIFQSARGCCACQTKCNVLYHAMADRNDTHSCQSSLDIFKTKIDCNIMKDIKKTLFSKHFPRHFQSFCCKIHVYWVINSLPSVCSHAIRTILMVWDRITLGFQPRVIRTQTINIFSYCMNKQGITYNLIQSYHTTKTTFGKDQRMPATGYISYPTLSASLTHCIQQWVRIFMSMHAYRRAFYPSRADTLHLTRNRDGFEQVVLFLFVLTFSTLCWIKIISFCSLEKGKIILRAMSSYKPVID